MLLVSAALEIGDDRLELLDVCSASNWANLQTSVTEERKKDEAPVCSPR